MGSIWNDFNDWADAAEFRGQHLRELNDDQLFKMAKDLLAAQRVMRDVEREWFERQGPKISN